jgi:phage regulator Rha-like protein
VEISTANSESELTMSSAEIAELTGKLHGNVKRVMESLLDEGVIIFSQSDKKSVNRTRRTSPWKLARRYTSLTCTEVTKCKTIIQ